MLAQNKPEKVLEILIIEDDDGLNNLIAKNLKRNGFECIQAFNGKDALKAVKPGKVQLLLMDYSLPDMKGKDLIHKLAKEDEEIPDFIVMTGYGDERIAVEMMKLGARDYLIKDENFIDILIEKLKQIFRVIYNEKKLYASEILLRKQSKLLKETGQMAMVGGWELDLKSNTLIFSEVTKSIHEVSSDYKPTLEEALKFYSSDSKPIVERAVQKAIKEGIPYDLEVQFTTAKGRNIWVHAIGKPEMKEGNCIRLQGIFQDITERKVAEEQLKESKDEISRILENSMDAILLTSPDGSVYSANPAACKLFGRSEKEICEIGKHGLVDFSDPRLEMFFKERKEKGKAKSEVNLKRKDGSMFPAEVSSALFKDKEGHIRSSMIIRDISDRKKNEENLKNTIDLSPSIIAKANLNTGFYIEANHAVTRILGYSIEEFKSIPIKELIHPDDDAKTTNTISKQLKGQKVNNLENRFLCTDGSYKWISWNATNADIEGIVLGVGSDVTERKQAEEELKQIEWLLEKEKEDSSKLSRAFIPGYEDVTKFNTDRTILDNVGKDTLKTLCSDIMDLLDTSITIYENNGDYAYGQFDSNWCQQMDMASFQLCNMPNTKEALHCGNWLCHDNCWNDSAKEAIKLQKSTDIKCVGGIHLYGVPIFAGGKLIGAINMGYGNPPKDKNSLQELSRKYKVDYDLLIKNSNQYKSRPMFIIQNAKKRLHTIAQLIGKIVESAQKEKQILENEASLKDAQRIANIGSWTLDLRTGKVEVSDQLAHILGVKDKKEAMDVSKHEKYYTSESWRKLQEELEKARNTGKNYTVEMEFSDENANYRFALATGEAIFDDNNNIVGLKGTLEDITEIKNAQQELERKNKELLETKEKAEEKERRFRTMFSEAPLGIALINSLNGKIFEVNQKFAEIAGRTREEMSVIDWMSITHPDDVQEDLDNMTLLNKGKIKGFNMQKRYIKPDNSYVWINLTVAPIFSEDKQNPLHLAMIEDITKQVFHEKELINAKEKAEESDRLKSAFLANMSHEIRTPMNGILGFTSLLSEPNLSSDEQEEYIKIIQRSGDRMLNTVNDIIDLSLIETGQVEVTEEEININSEIKALHSFFAPEAESKGLVFSVEKLMPKDKALIITDKVKLNSILSNLLKNAIKYTLSGSVKTGCEVRNEQLCYYVKDTGIGIPKERQQAIFDRFVQADIADTRVFEGSGLGLAISKAYAEMLGGELSVESEEGIGSTFWFTLPRINSEKKILDDNSTEVPKMSEIKGKMNILIAEDDEVSFQHLSILLKEFGKEIIHARNGLQALEICKTKPDIDLILMDIKLPEMNGYEATREIRKFNKKVPIIAQTAFAFSGDNEKALDAGCDDYISKPINEELLLKKISNLDLIDKMDNPV